MIMVEKKEKSKAILWWAILLWKHIMKVIVSLVPYSFSLVPYSFFYSDWVFFFIFSKYNISQEQYGVQINIISIAFSKTC